MSVKHPYQDSSLTPRERARDLVSRLTVEEKCGMATSNLDAIPRLGIPAAHMGVEIARGLVQRDQKRETTILPQPWGMAAMFDDALMERLGGMAGDEVRISNQMEERPSSLALFGPTVDMERDPRWGRNEEAYGEDPCLTGRMAGAYTRGLAGNDPKYIKCAPLLKHFYANNYEGERQTTNANITPRLKREYYLKAFETPIREGGAVGLMTAYNRINGVEGVNNPDVTEICKKEWGMTYAVSDGGDFGQNVAAHRTYEDHAHSIADILGVGADSMLDSRTMVDPAVKEALQKGYLKEEKLDKALEDLFTLRFMLGDFDPEENPYARMDRSKLACAEHKALAVKAAEESMILLENKGLLPLKDDGKCTVAVVGPLSNENYTCWYCGYAPDQTPVVKGLREKLGEGRVLFDEGFDRVVLKSQKTGKYVRLLENGGLIADGEKEDAEVFEKNDWDFGSWTLRSLKTGKYVTEGGGFGAAQQDQEDQMHSGFDPGMNCVADQAFGWFVMELLKAHEEDGALYLSTWRDRSVSVDGKGRVVSAILTGDDPAARFTLEVVSSGAERAAQLAKKADYAVVCAGNHPLINAREEYDRPDINLPHAQSGLLSAVCAANENTLLYLITGYPFAIVKERELAKAVLCSTHLGPCLGQVAARTIFGENVPAGRTPSTWYRSIRDLPAIDDYDIAKNRTTYLYFQGEPLYPFGYGLSYTHFTYSGARVEKSAYGPEETIAAFVSVTNDGDRDGDEVVQLYIAPPRSEVCERPIAMLKAFSRVHVRKGETVEVKLSFSAADLAFWCPEKNRFVVEKGEYALRFGASSRDIRETLAIQVDGEAPEGRDARKWMDALDVQDYHGVEFLTDKADGRGYLEAKDFRSFAVYKGLDLHGCTGFEVLLSSTAGDVDLILADNRTGETLGVCKGLGTGGLKRFVPFTCGIAPREGLTDLRLIFTKQTSVKSFHVTDEKA